MSGATEALPNRRTHVRASEDVLCVPRSTIFPDGAWHGRVDTGLERILRTIRAASGYHPRDAVEDDPSEQQLIPYCVVHHLDDDTYLLTQRRRQSTERRLHHLYSLGVGGHINPQDGRDGDPVVGGLRREWREEVVCPESATARLVAVLNDDSSPVSRVHLGLVFLIEVSGCHVDVRETDKLSGEAVRLEEMRRYYLSMESWSQMVFDDLISGASERAARSPLTVTLDAAP